MISVPFLNLKLATVFAAWCVRASGFAHRARHDLAPTSPRIVSEAADFGPVNPRV
jgi:hypothetical protein